ncbi:hypothetical protein HDV00_004394 [Rhizophlyctis rosea]|nr:hypothetical protein HDV00_004394 [Rhizophlyctis rosea]
MLEDEMFPLSEYIVGWQRYNYKTDGVPAILWHPRVRDILTLSDIISQIDLYVTRTEALDLVQSLLESAPRHEVLTFAKHVQYLLDTKPHWEIAEKLISEFPSVVSARPPNTHRLRCLIRSSSSIEVQMEIAQGTSVNYTQLYYDLTHIVAEQGSLEVWCQAIVALQKHHLDVAWLTDPRKKYHPKPRPYLDPQGNFDNLMRYDGGDPVEYYICGPLPRQFDELERYIRSGTIQWWPPLERCQDWLKIPLGCVGDSARQTENLLRWLIVKQGGDGNCDPTVYPYTHGATGPPYPDLIGSDAFRDDV